MPSTFFGLEISRRALQAQQIALNTTGHNISNAATPGYSRQRANLQATTPWSTFGNGHNVSLGTGVSVENITRVRDAFIDRQFRWETSKQQYWAGRQDALQKIEGIVNEPSDNSLHDDMDKFWVAWSDLSKNPENMGARAVVRERALTLTDSFHHIGQQISDLQKDQDASVAVKIKQINDDTRQIKDLNILIKNAEVNGDSPNDLRDKRDSLVDDLSNIVGVRVIETRDPVFTDRQVNNYSIVIGNDSAVPSQVLIDNGIVNLLEEPISDGTFATVKWAADADAALAGNLLDIGEKMGSLQATLEIRDNYLPTFGGQFDILAQGIASVVNALHNTGQGLTVDSGIDFFTLPDGSSPTATSSVTAATITLNSIITGDLGMIATGLNTDADGNQLTETAVGDGSVAIAISSLASGWSAIQTQIESGMFGPTVGGSRANPVPASSFGDYYGANIAQMGVDVQQANRMKAGQDVLVTHISNQQQAFSGVSLDEEMTNLVKFQKSYSAAARMVTMMDDMLDTIVNRMGTTR